MDKKSKYKIYHLCSANAGFFKGGFVFGLAFTPVCYAVGYFEMAMLGSFFLGLMVAGWYNLVKLCDIES